MPTYREIRPEIQSFDVILFEGEGLVSNAIKLLTGSPYSHVGLAMVLPEWWQILLWESTTLSKLPDLQTGAKVKGVQLVQLSDRLKTYEGKVYWRRIAGERSDWQRMQAGSVMRSFQGVPYEENQLELLKSALDLTALGENQADASSVFCSELAAIMLRKIGILVADLKPPNEYTPKDFSEDMNLIPGYQFGDIVEIEKEIEP